LHAVDVASGRPAEGMTVELVALEPSRRVVARGQLGPGGAFDDPSARGVDVGAGPYEAHFHVGDWMRSHGLADGPVFLDVAVFRFVVLDAAEHVHLPLKFTRWGYALFRGS